MHSAWQICNDVVLSRSYRALFSALCAFVFNFGDWFYLYAIVKALAYLDVVAAAIYDYAISAALSLFALVCFGFWVDLSNIYFRLAF